MNLSTAPESMSVASRLSRFAGFSRWVRTRAVAPGERWPAFRGLLAALLLLVASGVAAPAATLARGSGGDDWTVQPTPVLHAIAAHRATDAVQSQRRSTPTIGVPFPGATWSATADWCAHAACVGATPRRAAASLAARGYDATAPPQA